MTISMAVVADESGKRAAGVQTPAAASVAPTALPADVPAAARAVGPAVETAARPIGGLRPLAGGAGAATALDERTLVARAQAGDVDAFAELYRSHVGRVYAFAHRRSGSREMAEDLTSATFERAIRSLHAYDAASGGFASWLFRIASNLAADDHRRRARAGSPRATAAAARLHAGVSWGAPDDLAAVATGSGADLDALRPALDALNERYRRALTLRFLSGLSTEDAAAAFGTSRQTMAVVVHRALGALRKELARCGKEVPWT